MIFRVLPCLLLYIFSCQLSAKSEYGSIENGQTTIIDNRVFTKIILDGDNYSRSRNRLSIAKLFAQKKFLLHPYKQINWNAEYTTNEKNILLKNYLRLVKLKEKTFDFRTHRVWKKRHDYYYVFSIPKYSLPRSTPSADKIISFLKQSVLENNIKLDYVEMLEMTLRYENLFNIKHLVKSINERYGSQLLKFMSGEDSLDIEVWNGDETTLSSLNLDKLLLLQSQYTRDHNISYYLALSMQKHGLDNLMRRVVKNSIRNESDLESYQNLLTLAKRIGIPVSVDIN